MLNKKDEETIDRLRWTATNELRRWRPPGGTDNDIELQQRYRSVTGEDEWRTVPTVLED